jgi:hypothetical protein
MALLLVDQGSLLKGRTRLTEKAKEGRRMASRLAQQGWELSGHLGASEMVQEDHLTTCMLAGPDCELMRALPVSYWM